MLKQEFGRDGSSSRKVRAQTARLHPGLMALCLTQQAALIQEQTVYALSATYFSSPF
jgi:hypothetical protein